MTLLTEQERIPCTIVRGGTSRAVFFMCNDLPKENDIRNRVLLKVMGSPDPTQVDGVGGANVTTSKVAIIGPPSRQGADLDYTFCQVGIQDPVVSYRGNCGNIAAAVAAFAVHRGLVRVEEMQTRVVIHQTNTRRLIRAVVPTQNGQLQVGGDYKIPGVPVAGARIDLDFYDFVGSETGKLLPTGHVVDILPVEDVGEFRVSIVDVANTTVFMRAADLGLKGSETAEEINGAPNLLEKLERIRGTAAARLGFVQNPRSAAVESPVVPFLVLVSEPQNISLEEGVELSQSDMDFVARIMAVQKAHRQFPVTGAICTAVASRIPGTIVAQASADTCRGQVRIAHPTGIMDIEVGVSQKGDEFVLDRALLGRTARVLFEGYALVPRELLVSHAD